MVKKKKKQEQCPIISIIAILNDKLTIGMLFYCMQCCDKNI